MEAFTLGVMGKRTLSRKEIEDQKKKEDEAAAAHVNMLLLIWNINKTKLKVHYKNNRLSKSLWKPFKRYRSPRPRFGSKLEHMMQDLDVTFDNFKYDLYRNNIYIFLIIFRGG